MSRPAIVAILVEKKVASKHTPVAELGIFAGLAGAMSPLVDPILTGRSRIRSKNFYGDASWSFRMTTERGAKLCAGAEDALGLRTERAAEPENDASNATHARARPAIRGDAVGRARNRNALA